jgi:hypothetical protein
MANTKRWHHPLMGVLEGELVGVTSTTTLIKLSKPSYPHKAGDTIRVQTAHISQMKERSRGTSHSG